MITFKSPTMFSFFSNMGGGGSIKLPKASVHAIEERPEKRARTLKHLLKHSPYHKTLESYSKY